MNSHSRASHFLLQPCMDSLHPRTDNGRRLIMIARTQYPLSCTCIWWQRRSGFRTGANIGKDELQSRGCPDESWEAWHGRLVIFVFFRTPFHERKMMDPFQVMPSHLGSHIFSASQRSMVSFSCSNSQCGWPPSSTDPSIIKGILGNPKNRGFQK